MVGVPVRRRMGWWGWGVSVGVCGNASRGRMGSCSWVRWRGRSRWVGWSGARCRAMMQSVGCWLVEGDTVLYVIVSHQPPPKGVIRRGLAC
ncbi:hypothetical protein BU14_0142s0022 [Porphyra umbilicalis]|uniref:Uncharacterized protein n=1 Tax=Porphyra umbilicalis TaxID=2786 RepID=A0A1X6P9P4_PORUM|nr:hypothetical protein BU14_0142s0022 [Porphyra umbilicalis]|eukprot:OSX77612.1 hypothetical protein BU14_0142s0022 [Porphyra umbilicalis]